MSLLPDLLALLAATVASFYYSGIETGIYALNRVRLRLRTEAGRTSARRLTELLRKPELTIVTILICNHTANYLATFFSMAVLQDLFEMPDPELANTLLLTPFLFLFGEILPKDTFRMRADTIVYRWSGPLRIACVVLKPLALLFRWFGRLTRALPTVRTAPDAMLGRERLGLLVHEVAEEGVLTAEQSRMVRNVMRVSSLPVRDAMIPIPDVDTVPTGFTREDLLRVSARGAHTRIPVRGAREGEFIGVANVLDLVYQPDVAASELVRHAPRIPAEETVEVALQSLRRDRHTMGFVTGPGGETLGIVTVKDLVEEVSGELPAF